MDTCYKGNYVLQLDFSLSFSVQEYLTLANSVIFYSDVKLTVAREVWSHS